MNVSVSNPRRFRSRCQGGGVKRPSFCGMVGKVGLLGGRKIR